MSNVKRTLFLFSVLILVIVGVYSGLYFVKKYFVKYNSKSISLLDTKDSISGFTRDIGGGIPKIIPNQIVNSIDIDTIIESFKVENNNETQYTFRYLSKKNFKDISLYYKTMLSSKDWILTGIDSNLDKTFISLSAKNSEGLLFVLINNKEKPIVDISYILK